MPAVLSHLVSAKIGSIGTEATDINARHGSFGDVQAVSMEPHFA